MTAMTTCAILEEQIPGSITETLIYWDSYIDCAILCQGNGERCPDIQDVIISIDSMPHIIRWMQSALAMAAIGEI